jgi:hypothetical protein
MKEPEAKTRYKQAEAALENPDKRTNMADNDSLAA